MFYPSTVHRNLMRIGVSLTIIHEKAREAEYADRRIFAENLEFFVQHPCQLLFIDETHRDCNTCRRRRAYSFKQEKVELDGWFRETIRYTMIGVSNINGFVKEACDIILRDTHEASLGREGSAGTVDSERFLEFIRDKLIFNKVLGNYALGEPNSIVVLDNASVHNNSEVRRLIQSQGAILIMGSPYSPDLNPIEKMFSVYKASMRRNFFSGKHWYQIHEEALSAVTPTITFNKFRHCGVPMRGAVSPAILDDDSDLLLAAAGLLFFYLI